MKLVPMTDFVLDLSKNGYKEYEKIHTEGLFTPAFKIWICDRVIKRAIFLKQPLKLEMFVPCDDEGNVLEDPENNEKIQSMGVISEFKKAKDKVLFEGFEKCICNNEISVKKEGMATILQSEINKMTIEDLTKNDLILTDTGIKQLGF